MATLTPSPKMQFVDANGKPLAGGKLYTYASGTTTPLATYTDATGSTPNTNPIILDSAGYASIWLGNDLYTFKLTSSTDVLIWTVNDIGNIAVQTQTHAAAEKTSPADLDEFPLADSAASFGLKKLKWSNLRTLVTPNAGLVSFSLAATYPNGSTGLHSQQLDQRVSSLETKLSGSTGAVLVSYGQSNAARRSPQVTFSYSSSLKCFNSVGNEPIDRTDGFATTYPLAGSWFDTVASFSEFGKNGESYAPGFASQSNFGQIITFTGAIGSMHYRNLMTGQGPWTNITMAFRRANSILKAQGIQYISYAMIWDHGEADADLLSPSSTAEGPITVQQYVDVLSDLVLNAGKTLSAAINKPNSMPTILGVAPCHAGNDTTGFRNVQDAHLTAAKTISGYYLVGPKYAYPHETDGVHITGAGKRLFAEYIALRYQDILNGYSLPVYMTSATRVGAVITVTYNTISGDLVIDTTNVPETTTAYPLSKNGFEFWQGGIGGTQIAVSSVSVSGKTATITLASTPVGAGELRYAQMPWPGGTASVTGITSRLARGNIRDSGLRAAKDGTSLYNWACHQTISVV